MNAPLLIFDCDGVLVDSEPISVGLLIEYCAAAQFQISPADAYHSFLGKPVADATTHIHKNFGVSLPPFDIDMFQRDVLERFARDLRPVQGVANALGALKGPMAVASSSNMARIRFSLELTGLLGFFDDRLFSTDQVARGKPHPDVFLYAARQMGYAPADAIVVEDSPAGLSAAKAAGMRTLAFAGASHAEDADLARLLGEHEPDCLVTHMSELPAAIHSLTQTGHGNA